MADRKKMTEDEVAALCQAEIAAALEYDRSDFQRDRVRAIEYYRGDMQDLPYEEGRSSAVTHDVQDTIGWILPGLMRVFFSAQNLGIYEPQDPQDEQAAAQATDYANYVVLRECDGYQVFWDVLHDALLHANGIVKHWWEKSEKITTHVLCELSEDQVAMILAEDGVEVIEHEVKDGGGEYGPLHSLKIRRTEPYGCLKICAVPPEEFLINSQARDIETARFVGHRTLKMRSDLIEMGFGREKVDGLPAFGALSYDRVQLARTEQVGAFTSPPGMDKSTDEVEVVECYVKADADGDGKAETLRVWVGGGTASATVLDWEEWESDVPFTDFVSERVPHRWQGRSIFNDTEDVQRIKTALLRQMLDNLYQANIPDRIVNAQAVENPDALFDRRIGNVIRVQGDPNAAVAVTAIPFVAKEALTGLEYMDQIIERRTGVSRSTMALDLEALQNQSATAVNAAQSAAYSKIELIARNLAEMGFKRFFKCILKLIVQNQDRPKTIRLRNEWVDVDPRGWNADMDVVINVGLGSGSRDRDLMILNQIAMKQEQIIAVAGPKNPIAGISEYSNTMRKMVEAAGVRSPDEFFKEVDQATAEQMPDKPDPEMEKVKMQAEATMAKAQMDAQVKQQQGQADHQARMQELQAETELKRYQIEMELQLKREQLVAELQLKREQLTAELAIKREIGLKQADVKAEAANTRDVEVGGEPG